MIWTRFYASSSLDGGTLQQLRNLVNRRNVSSNPDKSFNATEDFFHLVGKAHIIAACLKYFKMSNAEAVPQENIPTEALLLPNDQRKVALHAAISGFIEEYFCLDLDRSFSNEPDRVSAYACELLSYYLIYIELEDAICEGDGDRVLCCWKFLFWDVGHRTNYVHD